MYEYDHHDDVDDFVNVVVFCLSFFLQYPVLKYWKYFEVYSDFYNILNMTFLRKFKGDGLNWILFCG